MEVFGNKEKILWRNLGISETIGLMMKFWYTCCLVGGIFFEISKN